MPGEVNENIHFIPIDFLGYLLVGKIIYIFEDGAAVDYLLRKGIGILGIEVGIAVNVEIAVVVTCNDILDQISN